MLAETWVWVVVAIPALIVLVLLLIVAQFFALYIQALFARAKVGFGELIGMKLRKVDPRVIVLSKIRAVQAGLAVETREMESHYLSGGRVPNVITALIAANRANIDLTFKTATAIDLAGRDILDAVQTSVNPKVIDAPDPTRGRDTVDAVAMDGIQLRAKARVTVRANLERLVGGATEETIIARVGEGIVTTIGSAETYKRVLENPDMISQQVLSKGLDAGTAFEILSIDIADVDVGENIGAQLQIRQAEADKQIAQAKAEERRAMAMAREQEMRAQVVEMRARVVEAEAEVPRAVAEAFRSGNLGVMDWYSLRNIQSDTAMRQSIAGTGEKEEGKGGRTPDTPRT